MLQKYEKIVSNNEISTKCYLMFLRTAANILQYASCVNVNIQLILTGYL